MLQFSVFVKFTGMLLLTPSSHAGALPAHALMPVQGVTVPMAHYPEVGVQMDSTRCVNKGADYRYDRMDLICYVSMDGWYMEIGPRPSATTYFPAFPLETSNLSRAVSAWVDPFDLGDSPDRKRIRGRVTLNAGEPAAACSRYVFLTLKTDGSGLEAPRPLANTQGWQMEVPGSEFLLIRKPLNSIQNHAAWDTITVLTASNNIVYVWNVTDADRRHETAQPTPNTPAQHFHAYYDLLRYAGPMRKLPLLSSTPGPDSSCPWVGVPLAPETPTCMVTAGLPPP